MDNHHEHYNEFVHHAYEVALGMLIKRTRGDMQLAEDILQQACVNTYERIVEGKRFETKSGGSAYLMLSCKNIHATYYAREKKVSNLSFGEHNEPVQDAKDLAAKIENEELYSLVQAKLEKVQHGNLLTLFAQGYKLLEIAEIENIPVGTVKFRLHKVRRSLAKHKAQM